MASATVPPPYLNGESSSSSKQDASRHVKFYEALFRLQEEVLADKHPRIHLPASAREQIATRRLSRTYSSSSRPTIDGQSNGDVRTHVSSASFDAQSKPASSNALATSSSNGQRPLPLKPSSSGINPVLLTKSDDLVRAEIQLKRQRIERELKDQYDAKKGQSRDKDFGFEPESRFDVSEILTKALELVKPISGLTTSANENSSPCDSFDENSYYSSQANSWTSDEADRREGAEQQVRSSVGKGKQPIIEVDSTSDHPPGQAHDSEIDDRDYEPVADIQMIDSIQYRVATDLTEQEDSDYSPPPASGSIGQTSGEGRRQRGGGRPLAQLARDYSPPAQDVPIIRNHIRTPVAPQPSRVSPLAIARKPKQINRVRSNGRIAPTAGNELSPRQHYTREEAEPSTSKSYQSPRGPGRTSPQGSRQALENRKKRRREVDGPDKRRNTGKRVARSPAAESPEPYIKPEPVSPPPLEISQTQSRGRRPVQHVNDDVEVLSPGDPRVRYYQETNSRPPTRTYYVDEPTSPALVRIPSQSGYRLVQRDDHDLRRVASLQYARRPPSPGPQPVVYQDTHTVRSASHAYMEPPQLPAAYRSGSSRPTQLRPRSSRSPPLYIDQGYPESRPPSTMNPPPGSRVVLAEYPEMYYHGQPQTAVQAPHLWRVEGDGGYERAMSRAPPRETNEGGMRPPPHPQYQYLYHPQRPYSMRPGEGTPREIQHAPIERRPAPATIFYEDMPPPREYSVRALSMHPDMTRREHPVEYVTRHESVQPGYIRRAEPRASVHMVEPQQRRYVEEDDQEGQAYSPGGMRRSAYRY